MTVDSSLLRYDMGIKFGGVSIPDPSEWDPQIADVDESAERDGEAVLHRSKIGQKINYSFKWKCLSWETMATILNAVNAEKFTAVTPNPYVFNGTRSGEYYAGNREAKTQYYWINSEEVARFDLSFNIIEF